MGLLQLALFLVLVVTFVAGSDRYHPENVGRNTDAFNPQEQTAEYWKEEAKSAIENRLTRLQNKNKARNVIMFLGDGMSIPTLAAARTLMGQRLNKTGEESQLFFESFPTVGLSKTYCLNQQIPDSACTATAYLCGVKNNYGMIGVNGKVPRHDCDASTDTSTHLESIAAWALADGKDAGIVTTTRITHASPAGTYARVANRGWENDNEVRRSGHDPTVCRDIAHQLVHEYPGKEFKVILGGGRREFLPNEESADEYNQGLRTDGRNLIQEWQHEKEALNVSHRYIWNRSELMSLMTSPPEYLLGFFETSHLQYHMLSDKATQPTLAEMTEIAIRSLDRSEKGYFLFVEGGRIDHAHHDNFVELSLDETLQFDLAIKRATELVDEDETLIVVTADHAHVMSVNGYTQRGTDILGVSDQIGRDGIPYMTVSYTNGPGARTQENNSRIDVTQDSNFRDLEWMAHAEVYLGSETHGGDDVAVFAIGPYHHMFTGLYEQTQIPHLMAYAACIGPGLQACNSAVLSQPLALPIYLLALIIVRTLLR